MDLRRMQLIDAPSKDIKAVKINEYFLGVDRTMKVKSMLEKFQDAEHWHPEFQAWLPLLEIFLQRGCDPDATLKYANPILQKPRYLNPTECALSKFFADIQQLKGSSDVPVFEDMTWEGIKEFSERYCAFFIQQRKMICNNLQSLNLYRVTGRSLLEIGSWRGIMAAVNLYRHCQAPNRDDVWEDSFINQLREKLGEWLETYLNTFDYLSSWVSDNNRYDWYCDTVRRVVTRVWSTSLQLGNRPALCTPDDVYQLSARLSEQLVHYVAGCPCVYDSPYPPAMVWNALCNLFFASDTQGPEFTLEAYFAMCIPRDYILRMCDILYDFHWCVQDERLPVLLYDRKVESYQGGVNTQTTPDEYKSMLRARGFPI